MKCVWPILILLAGVGCSPPRAAEPSGWDVQMKQMIDEQLVARGIRDARVLKAMAAVPRVEFVPADVRDRAYADGPLPIGHGQTISQPYIVAYMTEQLALRPTDRVLEIGTGSGYQAAVLAGLAAEVFSIEIVRPLAVRAAADLQRLGYRNVEVKAGDGYAGWPEHAPFDAVIVTCAPDHVPEPLVQQLKEGGKMAIPVGGRGGQRLCILEKHGGKMEERAQLPVQFVPMTGEAEKALRGE